MKKLSVFLLLLCVSASFAAAAQKWEENFEKAAEAAKADGKYMLLDFTGSDWCGWCIKLDKEVFSKKEFKTYAESNLVTVIVDFPSRNAQSGKQKKANKELAEKYSIRGYPTIILLSPTGELAGQTGYRDGGAEAYVQHLEQIIADHRAKTAK